MTNDWWNIKNRNDALHLRVRIHALQPNQPWQQVAQVSCFSNIYNIWPLINVISISEKLWDAHNFWTARVHCGLVSHVRNQFRVIWSILCFSAKSSVTVRVWTHTAFCSHYFYVLDKRWGWTRQVLLQREFVFLGSKHRTMSLSAAVLHEPHSNNWSASLMFLLCLDFVNIQIKLHIERLRKCFKFNSMV